MIISYESAINTCFTDSLCVEKSMKEKVKTTHAPHLILIF